MLIFGADLNSKMKIISVVGARPNFVKIAPFIRAIESHNKKNSDQIEHLLVHTGQHYDDRMSKKFFTDLNINNVDVNLGIGSGSHAEQVGQIMIAFEKVLRTEKPDWVVLVGDVNATLACSVTAKKEWIKCCHIEAGLRSGDISMPEEVNRLVTDRLSDLLLTPDLLSSENLRQEGVAEERIVFVGNIMIDTLEYNREKARNLSINKILGSNIIPENSYKQANFDESRRYGLITMHRPSNVDEKQILESIIHWLVSEASDQIQLIWPVHPRTLKQAKLFGLWEKLLQCKNIILLHPIGYLELLKLNMGAEVMLTDSGGLQEECCVLGTPFLTLRRNTERPVTLVDHGGAGYLVGNDISNIRRDFEKILHENRNPKCPELWDGKTAERCLQAILHFHKKNP
jgi:UDP-N-acetylglucosamine 2-epimerase (non-hydrolysing)